MKEEIIKLSKDIIVFRTETPKDIGKEAEIEIGLPEGVNLDSFSVNGIITDCRSIENDGKSIYILEMNLGELPEWNRIIFDAYLSFLERELVLDKIKKDNEELKTALTQLEEKMMQVLAASELLLLKVRNKRPLH